MNKLTIDDLGLTKEQIERFVKGARIAYGDHLQPQTQRGKLSYGSVEAESKERKEGT